MAISKRSEYALRAIFELAYRNSGRPVKIQTIAEAQAIPPRFLEAIMSDLKHAGFVGSRRGSEGGYVLLKDVQDLSVGDVLRAVQGQLSVGPEKGEMSHGSYHAGDKAFLQYWQKIDKAMLSLFAGTTFGDLMESERSHSQTVLDYSI
jgi:Rrf2 family transcriptional regulator, cysteine metabolism repressor